MSHVSDPVRVGQDIKDTVLRYIDSAYALRDDALRQERRSILEADGHLLQDVLLEPVLPYDGTQNALEVCASVGLTQGEAAILIEALFGVDDVATMRLREHQAQALRSAMSSGQERTNPVVTSGTGSGKTEAFLLPVLARLLVESRSWKSGGSGTHPWWDSSPANWKPLRTSPRDAAVRSVVLYPTNALVEDQIARLRRSLRRITACGGPDIWFGRYTSASPGGSQMPERGKHKRLKDLAGELRAMVQEFDGLIGLDEAVLSQITDPRRSEMVTRWDMVATPPDILVTNYSMLNVMLMRRFEDPVFAQTRDWLTRDRSHVFTLVVDELHLYRGTQGAEVALIVRSLLDRIGLEPDSPQLRIIGTSASLDGSGHAYLESFFGVPSQSFDLIKGSPREVTASLPVDPDLVRGALHEHGFSQGIDRALVEACRDESTGGVRAVPLWTVGQRLFGAGDHTELLADVLASMANHPQESQIPFRAHLFLRTMRGLWACSDPDCDQVDGDADRSTPVGKLTRRRCSSVRAEEGSLRLSTAISAAI